MMVSKHKELFKEGIKVEHEKFVNFNCFEEVLKPDLKPDDEVIYGTWTSIFKLQGGLPRCRMATRGFKQKDVLNYNATALKFLLRYLRDNNPLAGVDCGLWM